MVVHSASQSRSLGLEGACVGYCFFTALSSRINSVAICLVDGRVQAANQTEP